MSNIRIDLVQATLMRAHASFDHGDFHEGYEFTQQIILTDESLTEEEKTDAIRENNKHYDRDKIFYNSGTRRICENCNQKCLATLYCEYCVRNYLKANFSNWTSGNNNIDNLIKNCQLETLSSDNTIEWIPYNNLENIKYLTKGGFSNIYTAKWIDGGYEEWDSKEQQLLRFGAHSVILKELGNVEDANQSWFEEAKSHLTIGNKLTAIIKCYGITQNPSNGNYMLAIEPYDMNLREYLQQYHNQLTWDKRIRITFEIIDHLYYIHRENSIHRDLHSRNILYSNFNDCWRTSDLGFCGPADKLSTNIYGNLPYIAPEVISGKGYTFKSDIYSIAMLMWEISFGQPPFMNYEHDCILALNIIDGIRPKIISEIPSKYKSLMEQCWDANPLKRPDAHALLKKIREINSYYRNNPNELPQLIAKIEKKTSNIFSSKLFTSKIYKFENLPEPKNATKEEQEAFYTSSKLYDFSISDNSSIFSTISNQYTSINLKNRNEDNDKESSRLFKKLKMENETIQQEPNVDIIDEDEVYNNNPKFHLEEQDELKISDDDFNKLN
ncbi:kinase-like domain-containing protein [Rhizophagus irregularis DAOM 181602=DAOM 197198]|uniref:Kinase-like domain-containing protein n=1 Tax=Rhizophagus irregularis (strain DAOM 181602 / DAOM 197198 / MUCL 43194) TaxID=747089 RepID=A0A2H5U4D7_RHIID|nr:kinase-like domain-containing protein [Rhizophagus irregularis DAOM 181602=DAOM 197198]POG71858.1 kinase-like domain-containing protein [Rhizophagus irregularis DAOM 181602=DAOM 197198]|eukprot:XP_025178724.1 kinase-like domain-containing protein [Rhizophagus irregularis DAOM 181602=DAOM 197198]